MRFLDFCWDLDRDLDLDAKKKSVSTVEKISTSFKNWSRCDGRSQSWSRLVSTSRPPSLLFSLLPLIQRPPKQPPKVQRGITHFAENHFIENRKVYQKISGWSLCQQAFWHNTYGITHEPPQGLYGDPRSVSWVMKEWTEGWLGVRLGQVR